jgi:hypothetical protein
LSRYVGASVLSVTVLSGVWDYMCSGAHKFRTKIIPHLTNGLSFPAIAYIVIQTLHLDFQTFSAPLAHGQLHCSEPGMPRESSTSAIL